MIVLFDSVLPVPGTKQHLKRSKAPTWSRFVVYRLEDTDDESCWSCKGPLFTGCIVVKVTGTAFTPTICRDCVGDNRIKNYVQKFTCGTVCQVWHMTKSVAKLNP